MTRLGWGIVAVVAGGAIAVSEPLAAVTLAGTLLLAHRHEPRIPVRGYFMRQRWLLPALGWTVGAAAEQALSSLYRAGDGGGLGALAAAGLSIAAAAIAIYVLKLVFQGDAMRSIFSLVPESEQEALAQQLDELDAGAAGAAGQAADLSALDPAAVTAAIEQRVIGQDPIVARVVQTAFRRARLSNPRKPVATMLFVGATGAGKTELAKALAAEVFHDNLIRIDCNELSSEQGAQRLIGAPPGYIGSDQGGQLCRDLARLGTGVLLLDEIEKAHPAVLKVLMGLLDEARLTEQSTGRVYSARGFLIVMTSNAAHDEIATIAAAEPDPTLAGVKVKDALQDAGFLPEILARIDAVFPFAPLASRDVARVIERFLLQFASDVGIELVSADAGLLLTLVTQAKKTRSYGIREVIRGVENAVVDGLLDAQDAGATRAAIHVRGGKVSVDPVPAAASSARQHAARA